MLQINLPTLKKLSGCSLIGLLLLTPQTLFAKQQGWKITSESSAHDYKNKIFSYSGNAVFSTQQLRIQGDLIKAVETSDKKNKQIMVSGKPVSLSQQQGLENLSITAANISYQTDSQVISAHGQLQLTLSKADKTSITISGAKMTLMPAPANKMQVEGQPLQLTIIQPDQPLIRVQAEKLTFDQNSELFELNGNVFWTSEQETTLDSLRAARILYNNRSKVLEIPKHAEQPVEMTQIKKDKK